jgi:hypothetical protein
MNVVEKIDKAIKEINALETPDLIHDFLVEKGITGERQDAESCVITNYILTETDAIGCSTTADEIIVDDDDYEPWSFGTSEAMSTFIEAFDSGWYPDLVTTDQDEEY